MDKHKIVTINGQRYDAHTGLPVASSAPTKPVSPVKKTTYATNVHESAQKSQTLVRRTTKKPVTKSAAAVTPRTAGRSMDIARSSKIARFAPHPVAAVAAVKSTADIAPTVHPSVARAHAARRPAVHHSPKPVAKSSQDIKEEAITAALAQPPVKQAKRKFFERHSRKVFITTTCIIVALVGGYITYVNMPHLSVKVAATQAGIDATFPEYRPDGYSLDGPPTYSDGQVAINFVANTGPAKFTINQSKSSWDSTAVLNNIVHEKVGEKYITSQERGLTIYTYNGNAAWVNAGILYTIDGNAPLSGEQIRRIATSL